MRQYLKELRQRKNISQLQVGKKLGISESYYNLIENGQRQEDMKISTLRKLSKLFDITTDELIKLENKYLEEKNV